MKVKRLILLVLIIIWAVLVFGLSGQNGTESSGLSRKIVEFFTNNEEIIDCVEPYVRKLAHFSEYGRSKPSLCPGQSLQRVFPLPPEMSVFLLLPASRLLP